MRLKTALYLSFALAILSVGNVDILWGKINIMPLGDSITYDNNIDDTRPVGERVAYRQPLWLDLLGAGYDIDFVGSQLAGQTAVPSFDLDNEGYPGIQANEIRDNVNTYLATAAGNPNQGPVDIVLLHIGTNDITGQLPADVVNEIRQILDNIDQYDGGNGADIWVVLARIINRVPTDGNTTVLNSEIQSLANARIAAGDKIIIVNMENKLVYSIDQIAPYSGDMWDSLHPNYRGYDKMATAWFDEGLSKILPVADAGTDRSVNEGENVQLDGTFSMVPQVINGNFSILWNQIAGPNVSLLNAGTLTPSFTAPSVGDAGTLLRFRLKISDDDNISITDQDIVDVTVNDLPPPPVAENNTYSTSLNTTLDEPAPGLLNNDTPNVTAVKVSDPSSGAVILNGDGSFRYTPISGYIGMDSFTYKVIDSNMLESNVARVDITVLQVPEAVNDNYATIINRSINVSSQDGVLKNDTRNVTAVKVSDPPNGTLFAFNDDGSFVYIPDNGYLGPDSFTYKVIDSNMLESNVATVNIDTNEPVQIPATNPPAVVTSGGGGGGCFITATWN